MTKNRVKDYRLGKKLTQRQLAELVGANLEQLQRIESGVQVVRFDMAIRLSKTLETPLDRLFPSAKKLLGSWRKSGSAPDFEDEKISAGFEAAGIDLDPQIWTLKYLLRNGLSGFFQISGHEKRRLWGAVQGGLEPTPFVVFDSQSVRIALNRQHLLFAQFLFARALQV